MMHRCSCANRDSLLLQAHSALTEYMEVVARFCRENSLRDLGPDKRLAYERQSEQTFEAAKVSWARYRNHRAEHGC